MEEEAILADGAEQDSFLGETPEGVIRLMAATILAIILILFGINRISSSIEQVNYQMFAKGISNGLLAYSKCYSMTNDNLSRLAEGYLNEEDLNMAKYALNSNNLDVDIDKANSYFYRILHGCTGIKESELRAMKIYIVNIYTTYDYNKSNGIYKESYVVQVKDSNNNGYGHKVCNSTDAVEEFLQSQLGVKTDISESLSNSIHRTQKYSRQTSYSNGVHVVSSYNTYMCFGKKVPVTGWALQHNYDFCEMQTYSTAR